MAERKKHHFLPVFYLKQWANADGRLVEFKKLHGDIVKPRRTHPRGTGWIDRLYALKGVSGTAAVEFETAFLSPVDSKAADALRVMKDPKAAKLFSPKQRMAWAGFVNTLLARMPEDIAKIKKYVKGDWIMSIAGLEAGYRQTKAPTDPETLREYLETTDNPLFEQGAMAVGRKVMGHQGVTRSIAAMHWSILTMDRARHELLTSDQPVIYTNLFGKPDSHLMMPIGPRLIFLAVHDRRLAEQMKKENNQHTMVTKMNRFLVESADNYVFGSADTQKAFVQKYMSTVQRPTLIDRLHAMRMQRLEEIIRSTPET